MKKDKDKTLKDKNQNIYYQKGYYEGFIKGGQEYLEYIIKLKMLAEKPQLIILKNKKII